MLNKMLKAVRKMLVCTDKEEVIAFKARVDCARDLVDELILATEGNKIPSYAFAPTALIDQPPIDVKPAPPKPEPKGKPGDYKVVVDNNKIVKIENLPMDAFIELDGKRMTHKQAIGQAFITAKIV